MHNSNASAFTIIDDPVEKLLAALAAHGCEPRPVQGKTDQWMARCPAHEDRKPSLSVSRGHDGRALLRCHARCSLAGILAALGLQERDLFPAPAPTVKLSRPRQQAPNPTPAPTPDAAVAGLVGKWGEPAAKYFYADATGELVAVVFRWDLADGKQVRPVRRVADGWALGAPDAPRPLYRLGQVVQANVVFVVEGEKCADALAHVGLVTTTSLGGSKAANKTDWSPLRGKRVMIWPDNDDAGRAYAQDVARLCHDAGAGEVRIVDLSAVWPACPPGGDVADLLAVQADADHAPWGDAAEPEQVQEWFAQVAADAPAWVPQGNGQGRDVARPKLRPISDFDAQEITWLWSEHLPLGKLVVLCGRPGVGKSTLVLDFAARVSTGRGWPDGSPCEPGSVLLLSREDDPHDTLRPRLEAAGADLDAVHLLEGAEVGDDSLPVTLADVEIIARALAELESRTGKPPRLVVVDTVGSFLGSGVDAYRENEVRPILEQLAALARDWGVVVLLVAHLRKANKDHRGSADDQVLGSVAFTAVARVVWHVRRDGKDRERRLLLPGKCNLAPGNQGWAFRIVDPAPGKVEWLERVDQSADDVNDEDSSRRGPKPEKREQAENILRELLGDGPMPAKQVLALLDAAGIGERTARRARENLGVELFWKDGKRWWRLPPRNLAG